MTMKRARVAVGRRFGASPEAQERMREADAEATWVGVCRHCHAFLKGSLSDLKAHRCWKEAEDGPPG